jgi:tetratricopeptide (TPR) repeat protein
MGAGRYPDAIAGFEALLSEWPGFRDVAVLLDDSRRLQQEAIARHLAEGGRLEAAEEWAGAVAAYERAGAAPQASAARARMHAGGDEAYRRARQFDARNRPAEAIGWYERAAEWLPAEDARRQTARERLAILKGGGA